MAGLDNQGDSLSTIGARLALALLVPLGGLAFFGFLAADNERQAVLDTRQLRQEADLVELLSAASVELDVQSESIAGFQEAGALGVDIDSLTPVLGYDAVDKFQRARALDEVIAQIDGVPLDRWATPQAVERLIGSGATLSAIRAEPEIANPTYDTVRDEMARATAEALSAQTGQLNAVSGRIELGPDLGGLARAREPSLSLIAAAQNERQALADYLLPLTDRSTEDNYRRLIIASARYDFVLADLRADLLPRHRLELDDALATDASLAYEDLRNRAINDGGTRLGISDDASPLELVPIGIVTFADGFERTVDLLAFDRALSADFTAGAHALESDAEERLRLAAVVGVSLAALAIAASFIAVRSITRPLSALLIRAKEITEGDLLTTPPPSAPSDIAVVHRAFDEMSANLLTLSEQAEALSDGRLDDAVLSQPVAGRLGASVHGSVARLRSMTARLEHEATHDALTRLPNRAAVMSLLDRCLTGVGAERIPIAAVMLDLDGFKQANDDLGHAIGDEVLIHVADRLRASAEGEFVARLGGDEFMIVVTGPEAASVVHPITTRAIAALREPMAVTSGTIGLSASAGIVDTAGPDWLAPSEVLRRVDLAMYEAKLDGGTIVRFDQKLHDSLLETTQLQGEIRRALDLDQFTLDLQPIVETAGRSVVGYEALIRWHSPHRGNVAPGLFIPVAEQSYLVDQIDNWVIARSGEILAEWQADPERIGLSLSVNVSARHLSNRELVANVADMIDRNRIPASSLVIEVTESQLIPNLSRAEDTLRGLRELGVRLAIDDFGTGYASVAHLRRIKFDRVKIDRSFLAHLHDETDRALARLLVSLGRDLDLEVVAEGVETANQLAWATEAGCTHAQGYLLGHPSPAVALLATET